MMGSAPPAATGDAAQGLLDLLRVVSDKDASAAKLKELRDIAQQVQKERTALDLAAAAVKKDRATLDQERKDFDAKVKAFNDGSALRQTDLDRREAELNRAGQVLADNRQQLDADRAAFGDREAKVTAELNARRQALATAEIQSREAWQAKIVKATADAAAAGKAKDDAEKLRASLQSAAQAAKSALG